MGGTKENISTHLKISLVALVPHNSRKYCTILDLSFSLHYKGGIFPSINSSKTKKAPAEAMVQLWQYLQRIIQILAVNYNPSRPFTFAKIDIKNGFCWIILRRTPRTSTMSSQHSPKISLSMTCKLRFPDPSK